MWVSSVSLVGAIERLLIQSFLIGFQKRVDVFLSTKTNK